MWYNSRFFSCYTTFFADNQWSFSGLTAPRRIRRRTKKAIPFSVRLIARISSDTKAVPSMKD